MDKPVSVSSFQRLAEALIAWREEWTEPPYRQARVDRLGVLLAEAEARAQNEGTPKSVGKLRRDFVHVRLILDRTYDVGSGLEAWLFDFWLLTAKPEVSLSHGLQVFVCRQGLDEFPILDAAGPFQEEPLMEATEHQISWVMPRPAGEDAPCFVFQCFLPHTVPDYNSAPWKSVRGWKSSQIIGMRSRTSKAEVLAQLFLLGLRQDVVGQDVFNSLVGYVTPFAADVKEQIPDAVNHAVMHFLRPKASLGRYVAKVARGIARGGVPSPEVQQEAVRHGVSPRTIHRWRASGITDLTGPAAALREKHARGKLARGLAAEQGISVGTARRRITRGLAKRRKSSNRWTNS